MNADANQPTVSAPTDDTPLWKVAAWVVALWLAAHVVLIVCHVLLVFLYSAAIAPGLEHADYQAFALRSGPWLSIVLGGPVFYAVGRLLRRRARPLGRRAGLAAWGLYSATDAAIVLASAATITPLLAGQWLVSQGVKLWAVVLGTRGR